MDIRLELNGTPSSAVESLEIEVGEQGDDGPDPTHRLVHDSPVASAELENVGRVARDQRLRYTKSRGADELRLIRLGRVTDLGPGTIDDQRRGDLEPGHQLVVQGPAVPTGRRVGRFH